MPAEMRLLLMFVVTLAPSRVVFDFVVDREFFDIVTGQRKAWDEMLDKQSDPARSKDCIHPQAVARAVSDLAARDAVFVIDTGLNTLWSGNWIRQSGEQRIIYNNSALGLIVLEAEAMGVPAWKKAIDFPNPDYVALARACGGVGFKAEKPGDRPGVQGRRPGHYRLRGCGRRIAQRAFGEARLCRRWRAPSDATRSYRLRPP